MEEVESLGIYIPIAVITFCTLLVIIGVVYVRSFVTGSGFIPSFFSLFMTKRRGAQQQRGYVDQQDVNDNGDGNDDSEMVRGGGGGGRSVRISRRREARRAARRAAREAHERAIEEQQEREELERERYEERERKQREKEERKERERKAYEERKKKKEESIYNEWKSLMKIEEVGKEVVDDDGDGDGDYGHGGEEQGGRLLSRCVEWVKERKIVVIEEMAAEFQLRTEDAIDRLRVLEEIGTISGIFDDRGRFIYVTLDEMKEIATHVEKKGKVGIDELALECSRIIKFDRAS